MMHREPDSHDYQAGPVDLAADADRGASLSGGAGDAPARNTTAEDNTHEDTTAERENPSLDAVGDHYAENADDEAAEPAPGETGAPGPWLVASRLVRSRPLLTVGLAFAVGWMLARLGAGTDTTSDPAN
jgi:hypothetical protein